MAGQCENRMIIVSNGQLPMTYSDEAQLQLIAAT
jgi:hypothetical protein